MIWNRVLRAADSVLAFADRQLGRMLLQPRPSIEREPGTDRYRTRDSDGKLTGSGLTEEQAKADTSD